MENPGTLLYRARLSRRFRIAEKPAEKQVSSGETLPAEPPHRSSHASYTALMRSHDRMRTRHIAGQGESGGA